MSILIDIGIIAIIALSILMGYKKGLIGVAFKILSFFVALVLAFALSKPITNYVIENTSLDDSIHKTIQEALESKDLNQIEEIDEEESNVPSVVTQYVADQIKQVTAETQNEIAITVADNLTKTIVNGIVFVGIFLVARIILFFLKFLAEALAEIPILKQFNKLGGLLYGVLKGFFTVYLVFAIILLLAPLINTNDLLTIIQESYLGAFFYNDNLLLKILF